MIKIFRLSLIASVVLLAGCGGGDDEDISFSPTPSTPTPMLAMDGFATVTPNKESFIDLSSFVRGTEVNISSIKVDSDNEQCSTPTLSGTGVKVDITAGTFCQYTYTATQADAGQAQAALNVLATSAIEATLPPLSAALVVGTASTSFNVQTLLTNIGAWKSTYSLDTSSVTVHSTEGNLGSVDNITGNSFNFTPPELPGWNRIVFTLTDSEAPSAPVMGVLYVTISEEINQPPSISEPKYDYNANNPSATVVVGELVALDLASLPGLSITEPDNQEWQLVNALSWAATADATDPNSVTNKSIDFTASSVGDHYVTYIVADHYGGYASGLIKITVGVKVDPATWDDIETNGITYSAPDTYVEATNKGWLTTPEWDNGVNNTVAGYNSTVAKNYCSTIGRLPTVLDMEALKEGPASELALWPKVYPYLATNGDDMQGYNLGTGVTSGHDTNVAYYVTCVFNSTMTLDMVTTTIIANNEVQPLALVTIPMTSEGFYLEKADGTLTESEAGIQKGTIAENVTILTAQGLKSGTYRLRVTNNDDIIDTISSPTITYIGDENTASIKNITVKNKAIANGQDKIEIVWWLFDRYDNPIINKPTYVDLFPEDEQILSLLDKQLITDENGLAKTFVSSIQSGKYSINVGYLNESEIVDVEFERNVDVNSSSLSALPLKVIESNDSNIYYSDLTLELKDEYNEPISGLNNIVFKQENSNVNGVTIGDVQETNVEGVYTAKVSGNTPGIVTLKPIIENTPLELQINIEIVGIQTDEIGIVSATSSMVSLKTDDIITFKGGSILDSVFVNDERIGGGTGGSFMGDSWVIGSSDKIVSTLSSTSTYSGIISSFSWFKDDQLIGSFFGNRYQNSDSEKTILHGKIIGISVDTGTSGRFISGIKIYYVDID